MKGHPGNLTHPASGRTAGSRGKTKVDPSGSRCWDCSVSHLYSPEWLWSGFCCQPLGFRVLSSWPPACMPSACALDHLTNSDFQEYQVSIPSLRRFNPESGVYLWSSYLWRGGGRTMLWGERILFKEGVGSGSDWALWQYSLVAVNKASRVTPAGFIPGSKCKL